jgi:large subunit ribosomal protein L9e
MRQIYSTRELVIPDDVTCEVNSKFVTVTGPRGKLTRDLKHLQVDLYKTEVDGKPAIKVDVWYGTSKRQAGVRTVVSHINNMFLGVTRGYRYTMKLVYAHFPINITIADAGKAVEIRNFLGEKRVRVVKMLEGVTISKSKGVKDEITLEGNDIETVSRSSAQIHQSCLVRKKDIRKFLDGVYVNGKGHIYNPED